MFINMRQFLAILWTFELLLHFYELFSSNLQSGDYYAPIINRINYPSENILCLKNDKIITDILKKPENKQRYKSSTMV